MDSVLNSNAGYYNEKSPVKREKTNVIQGEIRIDLCCELRVACWE